MAFRWYGNQFQSMGRKESFHLLLHHSVQERVEVELVHVQQLHLVRTVSQRGRERWLAFLVSNEIQASQSVIALVFYLLGIRDMGT